MADLYQVGDSKAGRIALEYAVDDAWLRDQLIETGSESSGRFRIEIDLPDIPPLTRRNALELVDLASKVASASPGRLYLPTLPAPTSDVDAIVAAWGSHLNSFTPSELQAIVQRADPSLDGDFNFEADMEAWAEGFGSDRLRLAIARGYHATGIYLSERAALELPDFLPDHGDRATYREIVNPSMKALQHEAHVAGLIAENGLRATTTRLVWLNKGPASWEFDDLPGPAVLINFLGRKRLYSPVEDD